VITGTSSGIGEDAAKFFASQGWTVFAGVRKEADAERLRDHDPNIKPLILDVTDQEQVDKAFEEVRVAVGADGLDVLVNNAGFVYFGPVEIFPLSEVQKQYDVNLFGVIRVTQAALPLLRIGPPGRIVNVSSVGPDLNPPLAGIYDGAKAALDCVSESMRRELAEWGIKVSVLKPGVVKTKAPDRTLGLIDGIQSSLRKGSQGFEFYGRMMDTLSSSLESVGGIGVAHPSASSSVIYNAITSNNPRNFYWDTWGTWFTLLLYGLFPTWLKDAIFRFVYKRK